MISIQNKKIINRNNKEIKYNIYKIKLAILKALNAIDNPDLELANRLTNKVDQKIENLFFSNNKLPTIDNIQDIIEDILIKEGHTKLVKAYVIYRKQHDDLRRISNLVNSIEAVESYITSSDWRVKENSNMDYSLQGLNNYLSTRLISDYWIKKIYPPEIRKLHNSKKIHIHDLSTLGPYCVGWDLEQLLITGFRGAAGKVVSSPPKHFSTALGQAVNFIYTLQGEAAGAQAFSNFDTLLAPFIYYDNLSEKEVKKELEKYMFNMNVPTRVGFQTPFSNITLDLTIPSTFKNKPVVIGGKLKEKTYEDFSKEQKLFNKCLLEVYEEGDAKNNLFTFPIPTINITKEFDWECNLAKKVLEITAKYGTPSFCNYINSDLDPEDARSMCCRLRLDNRQLHKRGGGGLFGSNPLTGSIGVVTINMPQLGYLSKDKHEFFKRLSNLMDKAKDSLEIKRKVIEKYTDNGLYPYSKFNLQTIKEKTGSYWQNHFSTIGLLGMNEALLNLLGFDLTTKKGQEFTEKTLDFMKDRMLEYQEETGNLYNLEATPGEGTTYTFANYDKKKYPNIIVANEDNYKKGADPYYTNSTQLPVGYTDDVFDVLDKQDNIQCKYTGGTILHIFIGERKPDIESIKLLIQRICKNYSLPYFTISPTFSICPKHGYIFGEHKYCPKCDKEINYKEEFKKIEKEENKK